MVGSEPANVKKVRLAAEAMGMETFLSNITYHKPARLWASSKDGHSAGDVRTPAQDIEGVVLQARHKGAPDKMAFELVYAGGFIQCRMIDPVGKPVEMYFDYTARIPEGHTKESWGRRALEQDAAYNDGAIRILHRYYLDSITELFVWLDQTMEALGIEYKKLAPKPRVKKERTLMDDVMEAVNR